MIPGDFVVYNGTNSERNGILGVVLHSVDALVFKGSIQCSQCGISHNGVAINDATTVKEFSYNYYIPNGKCCHAEEERFCVLVRWDDFCIIPN